MGDHDARDRARTGEGATFETARVRASSRPGIVAIGFVLVVAAGAALGFGAQGQAAASVPPLTSPASSPSRSSTPPPASSAGAPGATGRVPVSLAAPVAGTKITTGTVLVKGRLLLRAGRVEVALVTVENELLASSIIDTSNREGGVRPARAPSVDVELAIPTTRPIGRIWVVVRAYDDAGTEIGELRRIIDIEPLDEG